MVASTECTLRTALQWLAEAGPAGVLDRRDGYRIYYHLTDPGEATKRLLFDFLRQAFGDEEQLQKDTERLKDAIAAGSCTVSEWKPYSAIGRPRTGRSSSRETAKI